MSDKSHAHNESTRRALTDLIKTNLPFGESAVLVALESVIAGVLLALYQKHPRKAVAMLEEGVLPGVIQRISNITNGR